VLAEGERIATQKLHMDRPERFWDRTYPLPAELTAGKSKIKMRFAAHPDNFAGGVFGVRTVKPQTEN